MALQKGILIVRRKGTKTLIEVRKEGKVFQPAHSELSQAIRDKLNDMNGKEVEFEFVQGQPKQIREVGDTFLPPTQQGRRPAGQTGNTGPRPQQRQPNLPHAPVPRDFHNPYNFIPAPPRNTGDTDLGDHLPAHQDCYLADRYSGRIRIRMKAETPLLVFDSERSTENQQTRHKTFPLRIGADGKPLIPASSVRGMLRSAYEAVTNSRFGTFSREQNKKRLAYRMDTREGLGLIPARIEAGQIRFLTGTSRVGAEGKPQLGDPLYAAWLPRYEQGNLGMRTLRYPGGGLPAHGDEVVCWIEKIRHVDDHGRTFEFWRVREVHPGNNTGTLGRQPAASRQEQRTQPTNPAAMQTVQGWVCVTNANLGRKHDERVFFHAALPPPGPFPVTEAHRSQWNQQIDNYQSIHKEDLAKRQRNGQRPDHYFRPGQTAWSRHVYTPGDLELVDGTLCYARLNGAQTNVEALFPVMIARELYPLAPWDLLPDSLKPAEGIEQLSPADRVFGWVKSERANQTQAPIASRGLLRVGPVRCKSNVEESVESFPAPGVPLAILSTPKPQQGRFYVAARNNGNAQADGLDKKTAGYSSGKGLRGRKVYPHHAGLPNGHWTDPAQYRNQGSGMPPHHQEYRRPPYNGSERDDQNRSVLGWVKPGARFAFDLNVLNLSEIEVGALLWMLSLPEGHYFRFGGGKPLGFGSVRVEIEHVDLHKGQDLLAAHYSAWHKCCPLQSYDAIIECFKKAAGQANFDHLPHIASFLTACRGFSDGLPVHYPRASADGRPCPPHPEGKSFEWFVENERSRKLALGELSNDPGLPRLRK